MRRRSIARIAGPLAAVATLLAPGAAHALTMSAGASPDRADVQGPAPLPHAAAVRGALADATPLSLVLGLTPADPSALATAAAQVSSPTSPLAHRSLTTAQFARRFGASPAEVATVRALLRRDGLRVGRLAPDRLSISVHGDARRVAAAFRTRLDRVMLAGGREAYADVDAPSLPAGVAADVDGVIGLSTTARPVPEGLLSAPRAHARVAPQAVTDDAGPQTCPAATADATEYGANTAAEIGHAYGMDGLWDAGDLGAGTTVAVYELEPFAPSDIDAYTACAGISPTVQTTDVDGGAGSGTGSGESALDIEDIAGLAPDATIDVYEGPNDDTGPYDTYAAIVDEDTAKVISTSWGDCETIEGAAELGMENQLFEQAALQGQAVLAAAGDDGASGCGSGAHGDSLAVDDPASQPYVTGVGGTSMAPGSSPASETVWNDDGHAAGGGASHFWDQPSWQTAALAQTRVSCGHEPSSSSAGYTTTASSSSCREVPDVSADADPQTGYVIDYGGDWTAEGGTSAAAPTWAAFVALADASSYCDGRSLGFLNPTLYSLPEDDFDDVTSGANSLDGVTGWTAGAGYDMASGLGAPDGSSLVPALCGASAGTTVPEPPATGSSSTTTTTSTSTTTTTTTTPTTTTPTPGPAPPVQAPAPPATTAAPTSTGTTTGTTTTEPGRPTATTVVLRVPTRERDAVGRPVLVRPRAHDRLGLRLSFSARRLPPGLRISHTTGVVSGSPRRAGSWTVRIIATDRDGNARSEVIPWVVHAAPASPPAPDR